MIYTQSRFRLKRLKKILWVFELQTDQPIPARSAYLVLINEKKKKLVIRWIFSIPVEDCRMKMKESEKIHKILGPCQRTEKAVEYESDSNSNHTWVPWNNSQESGKMTQWIED